MTAEDRTDINRKDTTERAVEELAEDECMLEEEKEDCLACHPYVLRSAELEREHERREAEKKKGRTYTTIPFRSGDRIRGGLGCPLPELYAAAPALKPIVQANTSGEYTLTVATCALVPELIEASYRARPFWVMHMPKLPDTHVFGDSTDFGVAENAIEAEIYLDPSSGMQRLYLCWDLWRRSRILVPADEVYESFKDADTHEGSIVIAFVGKEGWEIGPNWIPVGLMQWLEDRWLHLAGGGEVGWAEPVPSGYVHMRVRHVTALGCERIAPSA